MKSTDKGGNNFFLRVVVYLRLVQKDKEPTQVLLMKRVVSLASSTYQSFSSTFLIQSFVCFMEDSLTNILGVLSCTNRITYHAQEFVEVSRMCLK